MARVVLLNPPGSQLYLRDQYCSSPSKANYYWPPIDLVILSGILAEKHDIFVLDSIIEELSFEESLEVLRKRGVDFLIFITGTSSWVEDSNTIRRIKERCGCRTIASGDFLLTRYREVMSEYPFLDAVLLDFTSLRILEYLDRPTDGRPIPDVVYRMGPKIIEGGKETRRVFEIPVPRHDLFSLKKYRVPHSQRRPLTSTITNFGCPFKCDFCIGSVLHFKYREAENVFTELKFIQSMGVKEIYFRDFTFGIPRDNTVEICERMIREKLRLSWICLSRVDTVDEPLLKLMKSAGCHTIQFGVESSSQKILDKYQKRATLEQTQLTFALCHQYGIRTLAHIILGLPGETEESLKKTAEFVIALDCDYVSFNVVVPVIGTDLRNVALEEGWLKNNGLGFGATSYPTLETSSLSAERLWKLRNKAIRSFYLRPRYLWKKVVGIRSVYDLQRLFKEGSALILSTFSDGK
jgi:radical SAM superfamily enzyme YgiQ (UPF0313 family)